MSKWLFRAVLLALLWLAILQWGLPLVSPRSVSLPLLQRNYVMMAYGCALIAGINPLLFERQIWQESSFQPDEVSSAGAQGIAQLMPVMSHGLGVNALDPGSSLCAAARLMSSYLRLYGSYPKALAAYNAGSGRLSWAVRMGGDRWCAWLPSETQQYIVNILEQPCF